MTLVGNAFNIPQSVATTASPTFNGLTVSTIDITNSLTLNQQTGAQGEVLTSQGTSAPIWTTLAIPAPVGARCYASAYGYLSNPSQYNLVTITNFADYGGVNPVGVTRTVNGFTIQTVGIYRISYNIQANRGNNVYFHGTYITTRILKNNGALFTRTFAGTSAPNPPYFANMCSDASQMFSLAANDTIGFQAQTDMYALGGATTTCHVNIEKVNF